MKRFSVSLDPLLTTALDALARERGTDRTHLIQDLIYTALWQRYRERTMPRLRRAPQMPGWPGAGKTRTRVAEVAPRTNTEQHFAPVTVDQYGLILSPTRESE